MAGGRLKTHPGNKALYRKLFLRLILESLKLVSVIMMQTCPLFLNSSTLVSVKGDSMQYVGASPEE